MGFWTDSRQAQERLTHTLLVFKGDIVWVDEVTDRGNASFFYYSGDKRGTAERESVNHEGWKNFRVLPPTGFINTPDKLFYVERFPRNTMRHGLTTENTTVYTPNDKENVLGVARENVRHLAQNYGEFWKMSLNKEFPTYDQLKKVMEEGQSFAFSPVHRLTKMSEGAFEVYRRDTLIGIIIDKYQEMVVSNPRNLCYREELAELGLPPLVDN